ncbi:hypothetical protein PBI_PBS1_75 [Bacillus phage PBS1]|uniref:Uncharacterized protein n=1 Tax=Bacillus phage PBS1 TaxID=2884423 RepID=A0A223LD33_BPPB1|nr:hypothetical protein FK780_gp075 [Bacillus phage PBS1]AST99897.1 hypothetical protein PBI_PBS1_75 [Bacillus phage PBS1]BDE75283.1 hypothetical protein [Bacillus phage PBS1]
MEKKSVKDLLKLRISKISLDNEFSKINEDDIEKITNEILDNIDKTILTKHDFDHYLRNNVNPHIIDDIVLEAIKKYLYGTIKPYYTPDTKNYVFLLLMNNGTYERDFDESGIGYSDEQIEKNENLAVLKTFLTIISLETITGGEENVEKHVKQLMKDYGVSRDRIKHFSIN